MELKLKYLRGDGDYCDTLNDVAIIPTPAPPKETVKGRQPGLFSSSKELQITATPRDSELLQLQPKVSGSITSTCNRFAHPFPGQRHSHIQKNQWRPAEEPKTAKPNIPYGSMTLLRMASPAAAASPRPTSARRSSHQPIGGRQ